MKLTIISLFLLVFCLSTQAQILNYDKELERMVSIPNTPEAQSFGKYGNTSVSMYTGTPNISVPIYTIAGRELNLPISLTYDATGIKVDQLASGAGLNWNLNTGGRISRIVNGLVDGKLSHNGGTGYTNLYNNMSLSYPGSLYDKKLRSIVKDNLNPPSTFSSRDNAKAYFMFLKDVSDNKLDTQPDYFSFNALGFSDHFVYDLESEAIVPLDNPRTNVTANFTGTDPYISTWTIITEDGTTFTFSDTEVTQTTDFGAIESVMKYNSSWVVTQIKSPNGKDIYDFVYEDFSVSPNLTYSEVQPYVLLSSVTNQMNYTDPTSAAATSETVNNMKYQLSQQILTQIKHNGVVVVDITLKARSDYDLNSAIDSITIKKPSGSTLKSFRFNHSYFGDSGATDIFKKRLKLDSITIKSDNNTLSSYVFEYFSAASVPSRESLDRDYLGLFNNAGNTELYPAVTINNDTFTGADRSANITNAKIGTLKKITYPTKGYTEFEFELNKTPYTAKDLSASVQDITYGSLTVAGGTGSNNGCGICCLDQYSSVNPNINSIAFNVTDGGSYEIEYDKTNGGDGEAYLFHRSSVPNKPTIAYDSVIDQSSCAELVTMTWSHLLGSNGDFIYLVPGTYQMLLVKEGTGSIYLKVHREEVISNATVGTGAVSRAGLRIETIKDYDHDDSLTSEKEYRYTTSVNGSTSSGDMLFEPTLYTTSSYQTYINTPDNSKGQSSGLNTLETMTRVTTWSGGDRPHVAYSKVYEVQKVTGQDNGYVEHNFNLGSYNGVYSTGITPSANLYRNDYHVGKEKETNIYKTGNTLVKTDSTTFGSPQFFGNSTLYIKNKPENTFKYVNIYQSGSVYVYSYDAAIFTGFNYEDALSSTGSNPSKPSSCGNNFTDCIDLVYGAASTLKTYAHGSIGQVSRKTSVSYDGSTDIIQIVNNTYDSSGNYQLRETETTNSKGETMTTKYEYPEDFTETPYPDMVSDGQLTTVVQTKNYKGTNLLYSQRSKHSKLGNIFVVDSIFTAKGTQALEGRIVFEKYDDGNLLQVKQIGGESTAYIWGYDNRYVIAKVVNAAYSNIEALTGFGTGFTITNNLTSTQETALRGLSGALVTTYDYDPLVGVTSIKDPNEQTITYHYDEFNRLEYVKDKNGKILSQNQYNYKN